MRRTMLMAAVVVSTFGLCTVGWTPSVHAQEETDSEDTASEERMSNASETDTGAEESSDVQDPPGVSRFGGGSFDAMASFGLGGFLYPVLELGVDIGAVPVTERATVSVGATGAAGYCVFCSTLGALGGFRFNVWTVSPQARVAVHYDLEPDLGAPLDTYAAFSTGPGLYFARISSNGGTVTGTTFTWALVPIIGGRYFPSAPKNFFAFGEFRWLGEIGVSGVTYSNEQWNRTISWTGGGYSRRGFDFILGGGLRF